MLYIVYDDDTHGCNMAGNLIYTFWLYQTAGWKTIKKTNIYDFKNRGRHFFLVLHIDTD